MRVGEMCSRNPATVSTSATLADVARLMWDRHIGAVIVTKAPSDRPVAAGIVTDRDITCAQLDRAADLGSLSAEEVMTRNPLEINEEDSLSQAIERLPARGVRRAPVISSNGALVGLVSTDDLLACVTRELMHLGRLVALQPGQEEKRISSD